MLLPCGADQCPECYGYDTLVWVDEDRQEMNVEHLDCLVQIRKLELQDYLSPVDLLVKKLSKSTFPQENDEQLVSIALERGLKVQLSDKNPIVLHHIGFF